jgi:Leucine-rich repeat (LRR) protein
MKFTNLEDAAKKPLDVTVLDLSGWVTTADLVQFPNLILLRIANGVLELSSMVKLPQLEDLLLVNSSYKQCKRLSFLPLVFPNLLSIHLEYVLNSSEIGENIAEFKRLEKLIINQGFLKNLKFIKNISKSLNYLDVGANQIREIGDEIRKLTNLERLSAPANSIEKISAKLTHLTKLRVLNLSGNELSNLARLEKLSNLFTLDLSNNLFKTIPKSLLKCSQLHELYLSNNAIQKLPAEICQMPRLRHLSASSCQLKFLPRQFRRLQSLRKLELGENLFQSFPNSICELSKLERLNLNNNQIKKIPNSISKMCALSRLDIAGNMLTKIPASFKKLTRLYEVSLERNPFTELPRTLVALPKTNFIGIKGKKFLRAYRNAAADFILDFPQKNLLVYDILTGKEILKTTIQVLAELTHVQMPVVQRKAQRYIVRKIRKGKTIPKLEENTKVFFFGVQSFDNQLISSLNVERTEQAETADIWIIGSELKEEDCKKITKGQFKVLTEKEFFLQYFTLYPPYLYLPENRELVKNLKEFFYSEHKENTDLAINMMSFGGVPKELRIRLIFMASSYDAKYGLNESIVSLCKLFFTAEELDVAEYFWGFFRLDAYCLPQPPNYPRLEELCRKANFSYSEFHEHHVKFNGLSFMKR